MANVTEAQRIERVRQLVAELTKMPPEKQHGTIEIPGPGGQLIFCKVITIGVDEVVLNPNSHRVRAQLEDDPEWAKHQADPFGVEAQHIIEHWVRKARKPREFEDLKKSLAKDGQTDPGVVTSNGVLINANTRLVALRDLDDPTKRYIRVGVLPDSFQPDELALLELHLQMRKEHKAPYSFTNELLFIEELSKRRMSNAQIASKLDIEPGNSTKGARVVEERLRYLDLIRYMQQLHPDRLRLTFFDDVSYEHFEQLFRAWSAVVDSEPAEATRILEAFLLPVAVGFSDVKKLRKVDPDFVSDYVLPQLAEDELVGARIAGIALPSDATTSTLAGLDALMPDSAADEPAANVPALIDVVTQPDHRVEIPGTDIVLERDDVKGTLKTAYEIGVREKTRNTSATNKLQAPMDLMDQAAQTVKRCQDACTGVVTTPEFGDPSRKSLEVKFKKLAKNVAALEAELIKTGVLTKKKT